MSDRQVEYKPHYFELSLRSVSTDEATGKLVLNQEIPIVREYANTSGELALKQMMFSKSAMVPVANAVLAAMDEMSMAFQVSGMSEAAVQMEALGIELGDDGQFKVKEDKKPAKK